MKGIDFVVDDAGEKKAVLIDLTQWGDVWEDIYDILISESRKDEPGISWEELKAEMDQTGKCNHPNVDFDRRHSNVFRR